MKKVRGKRQSLEEKRPVPSIASFDFEVGTLLESPCRNCEMRSMLPYCRDHCQLLLDIQTILADAISSGHSVSSSEAYSVMIEEG
jgi:hypothetical protein